VSVDDDVPVVVGVAAPSLTAAQLAAAVDAAFATPIAPPRTSIVYAVALVTVGVLALVLPFLYIALALGLLGAGVGVFVTLGPEVRGLWSGFAVFAIGGGFVTASFALLAPMFRRRPRDTTTPIVRRPKRSAPRRSSSCRSSRVRSEDRTCRTTSPAGPPSR
jgi:hypothetical protein